MSADVLQKEKNDLNIKNSSDSSQPRLYKRRWIMLGLFSSLSMTNAMLWITYSPITDLVTAYFGVSNFIVNFLSLMYMIVYIIFVVPASFLLDLVGLRSGVLCGTFLNTLGAWIRYAGSSSNGFPLQIFGTFLASLAQTFILGVPPKVAALWFPMEERATATALASLSNQLGIAIGFLIGPALVPNSYDMAHLFFMEAVICSVIALGILFVFRGQPPLTPPNCLQSLPEQNPIQEWTEKPLPILEMKRGLTTLPKPIPKGQISTTHDTSIKENSEQSRTGIQSLEQDTTTEISSATERGSLHAISPGTTGTEENIKALHTNQRYFLFVSRLRILMHPMLWTKANRLAKQDDCSRRKDYIPIHRDTKVHVLLALVALVRNRSFVIIFLAFGIGMGSFYAISTLLDEILSPAGYSEEDIGLFGFLIVAIGLSGALCAGIAYDKTRHHKLLLVLAFFGTLFSLVWFVLSVRPDNRWMLIVVCGMVGFFTTAILPLCLQMAVECSAPVPEAISGGTIMMSAQCFGILFIVIMNSVSSTDGMIVGTWLLVGCIGISCIFILFFKEQNNVMIEDST